MLYTPDDYDDNGVLKAPISIYFAIFYAMKYYVYILVIIVGAKKSASLKTHISGLDTDLLLLAASIPTLFVGIALIKRDIGASKLIMLIWKNGRYLLSITLIMNAALLITYKPSYLMNYYLDVFAFFDIWLLVYINMNNKIKDVFAEFPN